jgi:hypothetical protein
MFPMPKKGASRPGSPCEKQSDSDEDLAEAVNRLADEVQLLRMAVDEYHEDLMWAVLNDKFTAPCPPRDRRIVSIPADPAAEDFAQRVNCAKPSDVEEAQEPHTIVETPAKPVGLSEPTQVAADSCDTAVPDDSGVQKQLF